MDWGQIGGVLDPGADWNNPTNWTLAGPIPEVREVSLAEAEALMSLDSEEKAEDPPPEATQPQAQQ